MKDSYCTRKYRMRLLLGMLSTSIFMGIAGGVAYTRYQDRKTNKQMSDLSELVFGDLYDAYYTYINLIVNEIEESKMHENATDVFAAYLTLQENGFISLGDKFIASNPNFETIKETGISIPLGNGVCRNQASNLYNVFKNLGYECGLVVGELYVDKPSGSSNHEVVYVKDRGYVYLFDPANKTIFLRNFFGKYISIYDETKIFVPSLKDNELFKNIDRDYSFYFNASDDYSSAIECRFHMEKSFEKVPGLIEYYAQFEKMFIEEFEKIIKSEVDEYNSFIEELKNENRKLELKNE